MPMLHALGQHQALRSVQSRLRPHERLLAFHDDVHTVAARADCGGPQDSGWSCGSIRNASKTQIWNRGTKPSSTKLEPSILTQRSGLAVLIVTRKNVASEFGALLLVQQSLSGRSWMPPRPLTSCCFSESQQCRTCSQRGFSCCSALHHGRHFIHGYVILTTPKHSHDSTTFTLGSVSPRCWGNSMTFSHRIGAVFLSTWGDWACVAHIVQHVPPSGAVGQIVCTLSANVTETLPTPSKALQPLLFTSRLPCRVVSSWPRWGTIVLIGCRCCAARRRKERTYPELVRPGQRAKLVVLAGEVAGQWSDQTASFLRQLARARARSEQAWRLRWGSLLACAAARAFACSLLEKRVSGGVDGDTPSVHEVLGECRFAGLEAA